MPGIPSGNNIPSGGNVLSSGNVVSGNNIPVSASVLPGTPNFLYDAANIDGLNNSTLVDGQGVATYVNTGSFGAGANCAQGTAAARLLYRAVAASGKINNQPAVEGDGNRWLPAIGAIAAQAQPYVFAGVFLTNDLAGSYYLWTGFVEGSQHEMIVNFGAAGRVSLNNGGGFVNTTAVVTAASWNMFVAVHNGASSYFRLNGVQSANFNTGTVGFTGNVLMGPQSSASFRFKGMLPLLAGWTGTSSTQLVTDAEAYLIGRYGAFPQ